MATEEPKQKKIKRTSHEVEEEEEERTEVATYPTDAPDFSSTIRINEEGDSFFELSKTRRVTVRQFKGTTLVDIREVRLHWKRRTRIWNFINLSP
jgi:hypothetical protein